MHAGITWSTFGAVCLWSPPAVYTHTRHHTNIQRFPTLFLLLFSPFFLILNSLIYLSPFQHSLLLLLFSHSFLELEEASLTYIVIHPHPSLLAGDTFQDPKWMPETVDSIKLHYVLCFSYTYVL